MSMLKYVFAFFAFIEVTLAPVDANEGYIPFFPDFIEPNGIGFRGTSDISNQAMAMIVVILIINHNNYKFR